LSAGLAKGIICALLSISASVLLAISILIASSTPHRSAGLVAGRAAAGCLGVLILFSVTATYFVLTS
jgi:hypothetical protein